MRLNCTLCQSSLVINESGGAVYCPDCDRKPKKNVKKNVLGGLLDAIEEKENKTDLSALFGLWLSKNQDEVTIQYHCIRCDRPTTQYGYCLWCEDELRETL